jgi:hypothetical protein
MTCGDIDIGYRHIGEVKGEKEIEKARYKI